MDVRTKRLLLAAVPLLLVATIVLAIWKNGKRINAPGSRNGNAEAKREDKNPHSKQIAFHGFSLRRRRSKLVPET